MNKSIACRSLCSAVVCLIEDSLMVRLIEDKKSKSKNGHYSEKKKMYLKLSPLIVWIALWIVNKHSEFQVNIFSNNGDIINALVFVPQ